ncbi:acyl-CoA thioesterase [Thiorhodospira sibirica]|uniref:acyl-CoA thioesterase n=1 Tax=Thiorhodospira sibirica TaxID=154347 RepID=UPI00022C5271|nr:acyl-CoA thioesterase [Thiorhodospira sibirica]
MPIERPVPLPEEYELTYRVAAMPADTNYHGDIFGGWIMSQVDIAGSVLAVREARGRVATVAVKEFRFIERVLVGDLVSCYTAISRLGHSSITVKVEVYASRQFDDPAVHRVAEAVLVYVALDHEGRPRPVKR